MSEGLPATDAAQSSAAPAAATLTRAALERDHPQLLEELRAHYIALGVAAEAGRIRELRSVARRAKRQRRKLRQQGTSK